MFGKKSKQQITRLREENAQLQKSILQLEVFISELCAPKGACCKEKKAVKTPTKKVVLKKPTKVEVKGAGKNVRKSK